MLTLRGPARSAARPGHRLLNVAGGLLAGSLLGACMAGGGDPALLPDGVVLATAAAVGCAGYGTAPHSRPSPTPTPTGLWVPPRPSATPTPTRPTGVCDYCTMPPRATRTPRAWPAPLTTCPPAPGQPTSTPPPTEPAAAFPTLAVATALPAILGVINPLVVADLEGEALPGGVAVDPRGRPVLIWSQLNPDPGQETAGRVYLQTTDPATGQWLPLRSVNPPGNYKIGKAGPESAVGVAADGTIYVTYAHTDGGQAVLAWRASTDGGTTWSPAADFPFPSSNDELYNVRLSVDPAGQPHILALVVPAGCAADKPCGDLVYYERRADGGWRQERRPVSGGGARQYSGAVATFPLADGTTRTVLAWSEDRGGEQAAYASYKDGPAGAWSRPIWLSTRHPAIPDYEPGFGGSLRVLAFPYGGQPWVWVGYSLYSTGYLASLWSADGGATWSPEDYFAYLPIAGDPPAVVGTIHDPTPYWAAAHGRLLVVADFCTRGADRTCFPVLAYGAPGAVGREWAGYISPTDPPLRAFGPTAREQASQLRGPTVYGAAPTNAVLLWQEPGGTRALHLARLNLDTLMNGTEAPR